MASATERLYDLDVQHQIGLARLSSATVRKTIALLNRVDADLQTQIRSLSWEEVERQSAKLLRLEKMVEAVRVTLTEANAVALRSLQKDLNELAEYEAEFQGKIVSEVRAGITVQPTADQLKAAVNARPFSGRVLREWGKDWDAASFKRVRDSIRISFVEGESIESAIRRIRGTKAGGFKDGVLEISRRGAEVLVRTAITHVASVSKEEFFKANASVFRGLRWSSILDSRTTAVCRGRDGKVYKIGEGPRPPAHPRCRSTMVGILPGDPELPAEDTYQGWLSRQSREVQDDILGKAKGRLFRDGGLSLDKFTNKVGDELTLDQLRARESKAFEKAGLSA